MIAWWTSAWADEPEAPPPVEAPPAEAPPAEAPPVPEASAVPEAPPPKAKVKGYVLPTAGGNSTDGFGLGAAGELFLRPPELEHGFRWKLSLSVWATTRGYRSFYSQYERRTAEGHLLARLGFQSWANLPYAGVGGADVSVRHPPEQEIGNRIFGPYLMVADSQTVRPKVKLYGQIWLHPVWVDPRPGGLLDTRDPFAADGGLYGDLMGGIELDTTDRWPMPTRGVRAEVDLRGGGTWAFTEDRFAPLVGGHAEVITWQPVGEHLVIGARVVAEKSYGLRPPPEQFVTGGRWRDEIGFEQALSGYGRIRPRGDGVVASLVEVRPYFFTVGRSWSLDVHASLFAEMAWLYRGNDPGPPMPTVGLGPLLLWQKGSQLRPFVAWGWWSDDVGGARRPVAQFGLSVNDPL